MTTRYDVAIRRPTDGHVLLLRDRTLPGFTTDSPPPWQDVAIVVDTVRARFGLDVVALRALRLDGRGSQPGLAGRLYEAEHVGGALPDGAAWTPKDDAGAAVAALLHTGDDGHHPWYRAGWLAEMTAWIDARLGEAGVRRRGPVRQVRSWGRAALLTLDTDRGRLWAKAVPRVFAHEIAVTELLADVDPGFVPPVVAADRAVGRIITEHVEGRTLTAIGHAQAIWTASLSRLAEVQRVLAEDLGTLRIAGVAAAPLERLAGSVPDLLADDDLLLVGRPGGLSAADAARLRDRVPDLVAACRQLAGSGIGDSLEHGDLAADEIILGPMGPVFLDWSDGSITHPFLSAASLLRSGATHEPAADDLEAAYLGPWLATRTFAAADGRAAMALARIVLPLHLTAMYAERILPGLEQRWEVERVVPDALRSILRG